MDNYRKSRKRMLARYGSYYAPFKPPGYWSVNCCCYCGNVAESKDHIPPLVWIDALGPSWFDERGLLVVWVPSCLECNNYLGSRKLFTIRERTIYLIGKYEEKYKSFRRNTAWEDDDLKGLTGRLKIEMANFKVIQDGIDRRISILE